MKRRTFVKHSSLMAMSVSAFGAIHWNGTSFVGDTPTTTDILGPFYRPGTPMRSDVVTPGSKGTPMNLNGTIFKEDGTTPLSDVLVEIWQCDETEYYDNTSDDYLFRGALKTGKDGKYSFNTIVPVPYKLDANNPSLGWRPAHVHMRVSAPNQQDLITQLYIKGDKYIPTDMSASSPLSANRILEVGKGPKGGSAITFNVVMAKQFALDPTVFNRLTGLYKIDKDIVEFQKSDDLLFVKLNGQLAMSMIYTGQNTFVDEMEGAKVTFELLTGGGTKATVVYNGTATSGERYLKYSDK